MPFTCIDCREDFDSEFVPARDHRTGQFLCAPCQDERRDRREREYREMYEQFPEPRVVMAQVDNRENW